MQCLYGQCFSDMTKRGSHFSVRIESQNGRLPNEDFDQAVRTIIDMHRYLCHHSAN